MLVLYTRIRTYIYANIRTYVDIYIHTRVRTHTHAHTRTHTHTHTYLHTLHSFIVIVPKFPQINGTSCYSIVRDHDSGLSNITIQYRVSTGGRSLAVFSAMAPKLTVVIKMVIPFLNRVTYRPLRSIPGVNSAVKVSCMRQTVYGVCVGCDLGVCGV